MGMRKELLQGLREAFNNDLSDAVSDFTGFREGTEGAYDPVSDSYAKGEPVNYSGSGVFSDFDTKFIDDIKVKTTDKQLLVLTSEVTEEPQLGDIIDDVYTVHNKTGDPVGATYRLHLRKH